MKEIIRYYIDHRLPAGAPGQRIGIGLIADQNPPLRPNSHWFRFLNQDTVFFDGIEKMALKFHMPVYFCRQRRLREGITSWSSCASTTAWSRSRPTR